MAGKGNKLNSSNGILTQTKLAWLIQISHPIFGIGIFRNCNQLENTKSPSERICPSAGVNSLVYDASFYFPYFPKSFSIDDTSTRLSQY